MSGRSILLVEDDEDQVILALRALRKHGIVDGVDEVVVIGDGEEALDYLLGTRSRGGPEAGSLPKFVLLDVNLPGTSGLRVLERLRSDERTRLLPVVLFSSSGEREDVIEGYRMGANNYVAKPTDCDRFSEALHCLGWYWLSFNEAP